MLIKNIKMNGEARGNNGSLKIWRSVDGKTWEETARQAKKNSEENRYAFSLSKKVAKKKEKENASKEEKN